MANDILNRESAERALYPAPGLPGGGQLEVRMEISQFHPDPDIRGVARRVKSFNLESWHTEWTEAARKNEELAFGFFRIRAGRAQGQRPRILLAGRGFLPPRGCLYAGFRPAHAADVQET
jgi:hypothetical protein